MLDRVIAFADSVNAGSVTICVDKMADTVLVTAEKVPGIQFSVTALRTSNGGMLNDATAQKALNEQLGNTEARGSKTLG